LTRAARRHKEQSQLSLAAKTAPQPEAAAPEQSLQVPVVDYPEVEGPSQVDDTRPLSALLRAVNLPARVHDPNLGAAPALLPAVAVGYAVPQQPEVDQMAEEEDDDQMLDASGEQAPEVLAVSEEEAAASLLGLMTIGGSRQAGLPAALSTPIHPAPEPEPASPPARPASPPPSPITSSAPPAPELPDYGAAVSAERAEPGSAVGAVASTLPTLAKEAGPGCLLGPTASAMPVIAAELAPPAASGMPASPVAEPQPASVAAATCQSLPLPPDGPSAQQPAAAETDDLMPNRSAENLDGTAPAHVTSKQVVFPSLQCFVLSGTACMPWPFIHAVCALFHQIHTEHLPKSYLVSLLHVPAGQQLGTLLMANQNLVPEAASKALHQLVSACSASHKLPVGTW